MESLETARKSLTLMELIAKMNLRKMKTMIMMMRSSETKITILKMKIATTMVIPQTLKLAQPKGLTSSIGTRTAPPHQPRDRERNLPKLEIEVSQ
jgi:hypothetical protein